MKGSSWTEGVVGAFNAAEASHNRGEGSAPSTLYDQTNIQTPSPDTRMALSWSDMWHEGGGPPDSGTRNRQMGKLRDRDGSLQRNRVAPSPAGDADCDS